MQLWVEDAGTRNVPLHRLLTGAALLVYYVYQVSVVKGPWHYVASGADDGKWGA
jgi:hypothetical protein